MRLLLIGMFLFASVVLGGPARAAEPAATPTLTVYMISGATCPHCAEARTHFDALRARHPDVVVEEIEIWENRDNRPRARALAARAGAEFGAVPLIIVGDRHWIGFRPDPIGIEIDAAIERCLAQPCVDLGRADAVAVATAAPQSAGTRIELPLVGSIDLGSHSLLVSTALIAFVDGFNACSLWVLSLLLAITLHSGRRGRVLLIGLVFLTVSSAIYALFIAGIVTATHALSFSDPLRVVMALVALLFALVNIKDWFWYGRGPSLSIPAAAKSGLYKRMRAVASSGNSLPALVGATIVLSAGASMVEFACTAGFPLMWGQLLAAQQATSGQFAGLLVLYMLIYQADELAIFIAAVVTMRAMKLEERHGRLLKLAAGMLLLALALTLLIAPATMNEPGPAALVFLAAAGATAVLVVADRWARSARRAG